MWKRWPSPTKAGGAGPGPGTNTAKGVRDGRATKGDFVRQSLDQFAEKEQTIQSQLEALRQYSADKGFEIIAEYLDEGYCSENKPRSFDWLRANGIPTARGELVEP